jgi:hypothetical protein
MHNDRAEDERNAPSCASSACRRLFDVSGGGRQGDELAAASPAAVCVGEIYQAALRAFAPRGRRADERLSKRLLHSQIVDYKSDVR